MAKNSVINHETAAAMNDTFCTLVNKIERKAVRKLGKAVSANTRKAIVQGVDRQIEGDFGYPMRKLFEL